MQGHLSAAFLLDKVAFIWNDGSEPFETLGHPPKGWKSFIHKLNGGLWKWDPKVMILPHVMVVKFY